MRLDIASKVVAYDSRLNGLAPAAIVAHDLFIAGSSFILALLLRNEMELSASNIHVLLHGTPLFLLIAGVLFWIFGLHQGVWSDASVADLTAIVKASTCAILIFLFMLFVVDRLQGVPRSVPVIQWFVLVVLLGAPRLGCRLLVARAQQRRAPAGATPETPVLLYGCGPLASLFVRAVGATPGAGLRVVGLVDDVGDHRGRCVNGVPVVGHARDLGRILARLGAHGVYAGRLVVTRATDELPADARAAIAAASARHALEVEYLPDLFGLRDGAGAGAAQGAWSERTRLYFRLRRVVEVALSAAALLALFPVLAAVAALVLVDGGRPVLFRQVRPGRYMRPFTLYKFRTMRIVFAPDGTPVADDARTSPIGRFLRRTRLDELPQLHNVLVGDMAFIGPRPLLPRDLPADVTERAAIRPGITGWAQVNGGQRLTVAEMTALDAWYVRHANPAIDARIVWLTVKMMLFGDRIDRVEILRATATPAWVPEPPAPVPRLLIVNRCFHPDHAATAQLLTDLVDALDRGPLAVTVVTGRQRYDDPGGALPARATCFGAEVRRLWTTRFGRAWLPGRAVDDATFYASAFLALLAHTRRGDVLLAKTDPPLISVVAWAVARLTGARLVNWCQDLFPETAAALGIGLARGPAGALLRAARNRSLKAAALNVVLCERMAERLAAEGVPARSVAVIHNWADGKAIRPLAPEANPLRRAWGLDGAFVLGYSGNLGRAHDVDSVVELVEALGAEPDLAFLFIGGGSGHRRLKDAVAARRIPNVLFRPYQPRERLALSLTAPDLHLVTLNPACEGLIMPSKLYGVLAAGRPVAVVGDHAGAVARIVLAHDAGLVGAPGDVAALAAAIRTLRRDPKRLARLGANARRAYDAAFNKEASLNAWVRHLSAVAAIEAPAPRLVPAA